MQGSFRTVSSISSPSRHPMSAARGNAWQSSRMICARQQLCVKCLQGTKQHAYLACGQHAQCYQQHYSSRRPHWRDSSLFFSFLLRAKLALALAKAAASRITINLDGAPTISKSHTHPSHSQISRLLTSSLSLGIPVPRTTQCIRGM